MYYYSTYVLMLFYHVTIDGCNGGDLVKDTPAEKEPYFGCIPGDVRDTCPALSGVDPIHNYMDYSDDVCLTGNLGGEMYIQHVYVMITSDSTIC